jgi:hypothetical protein
VGRKKKVTKFWLVSKITKSDSETYGEERKENWYSCYLKMKTLC